MARSTTIKLGDPGFTLVEVLVCAVLLAIGFLALVAAFGHESVCAQRGEDAVLATFLADEIRDLALQMAFADVFALDAAPYNPAILSTGASAGLADWSQHVTILALSAMDLAAAMPEGSATAARLTVEVRRHSKPVLVQTYYIFNMQGVPFTDDS
ncbi:MAG: prepilin-type N-terminal cleavage/methylation domain-containing protein [Planctomycetes bacterium]|nr:prepilin-type N-terminal cleavage/methylation domain-containing protein [Planctomycetota bacterium]